MLAASELGVMVEGQEDGKLERPVIVPHPGLPPHFASVAESR